MKRIKKLVWEGREKMCDVIYFRKIQELIDAVNKLYEWTGGFEIPEHNEICDHKCEKCGDVFGHIVGTHASNCECYHCKPTPREIKGGGK